MNMKKENKMTDNTEIQRMIKNCYEQLFTDTLESLKEVDQFLNV